MNATLSTGTIIPANAGIIGISEGDFGRPVITEGYDSILGDEDKELTKKERGEIAAYFISLWKKWATSSPEKPRRATVDTSGLKGFTPPAGDIYEDLAYRLAAAYASWRTGNKMDATHQNIKAVGIEKSWITLAKMIDERSVL